MPFLFPLPSTSPFNFSIPLAHPARHSSHLIALANSARATFRLSLKSARKLPPSLSNYSKIVNEIHQYLPLLLAIINAVDSDCLLISSLPAFSWSSTLSSPRLSAPQNTSIPSFNYELSFVLLSLALATSNAAYVSSLSIGPYELGTELDRQSGDLILSQSVDALCKAAGLFDHLSQTIIPNWENQHPHGFPHLRSIRPPELSRESTAGLSNLVLADAERLAIRRLLSRSSNELSLSPGSGLPKSHPSPVLLAKLELNISNLDTTSKESFKLATGFTDLIGSIKRYVADQSMLSLAKAYKWLAVDAGEKSHSHGEAIAWCLASKEILKKLITTTRNPSLLIRNRGSSSESRSQKKSRVEDELKQVEQYLKVYVRLNQTVTFEPVPASTTLLSKVPGGRSALSSKPYQLPAPALIEKNIPKDGSQACLSSVSGVDEDESDDEDYNNRVDDETGPMGSYALQDSYF